MHLGNIDPDRAADIDRRIRDAGATIRWRGVAPAVRARLAPVPAGTALMQRIRAALDPGSVFAGPRLCAEL